MSHRESKTEMVNKTNLTRRNFVKTSASAVAFSIVPRYVLGGPGHTAPSEKLNMRVIRCVIMGLVLIINLSCSTGRENHLMPVNVNTPGELREVIVSHTDENGILQLYRMKENGSDSHQLTHGNYSCVQPACSVDGKKIVYIKRSEKGMAIWLCDTDGHNAKELIKAEKILVPSWLPDSKHIVWMSAGPGQKNQDPAGNSQIRIMNTQTGQSRRLFSDPEQIKFSNAMPVVSSDGTKVAFVSNRSGAFRIWVSNLDGSDAKLVSPTPIALDAGLKLPIEQKVPSWSPDGKWIAHWQGVEMIHMSPFTGVKNPRRDQQISATFNVWVVSSDGKHRRKVGPGDDPTWSPDGFVTRAFSDSERGGPKIMIETESGEKELPIVPRKKNWGRFTWLPEMN